MTLDVGVRALSAPAAAVIEEMTYTITPVSVNVQAGIVVGEITGMRVVERVAKSTGGTVSPARLTGTLTLTNTSASQSVRRSEEHTSELQSHSDLVCRLL